MDFKNVMFSTDMVLVHRPTGRRFFHIPAHSVKVSVNGLEVTVQVAETLAEVINNVMCPASIPATLLYDEWDVGSLEAVMPDAFRSEERTRVADSENRVGFSRVSLDLWVRYGAVLRAITNMTVKDVVESTQEGFATIFFSSPDITPVSDGKATPEYTIVMYDGEMAARFELVKSVKL